ncbi:hypothetical protein DNK47_01460 [Mycoplasma wenyonii]|uniref:Uncharacterized protein n=1 Tax=Mycoplasma wenyonii TaxID=65123 RepID=A0A328PVI8_9MOLU|nr:hypothetical protein [Mycoplasma wenyonii]RAO95139.1 hypothetical protein DNK47_01460 [Mycoplasma wenyonii]
MVCSDGSEFQLISWELDYLKESGELGVFIKKPNKLKEKPVTLYYDHNEKKFRTNNLNCWIWSIFDNNKYCLINSEWEDTVRVQLLFNLKTREVDIKSWQLEGKS